jgi:hypothetical protein
MIELYKNLSEKFVKSVKFRVERFLIRGPFYQILFIGAVICFISFTFGQMLFWVDPTESDLFKNAWWAFLRMSDPGYLGDDNGTYRRILATVLTILGYVLFMGSLVAIMTQWLYKTMKELESGFTPMNTVGHISILGYTNRTPLIIGQILTSKDKMNIILKKLKRSGPAVAVLNETVGYELIADLKADLPRKTNVKRVVFRSGDLISSEDLGRINVERSSVVIIPAKISVSDRGFSSDMSMIKALLTIKNRAELAGVKLPKVVAEVLDEKLKDTAKKLYGDSLEVVSSRSLVARLISQNIHHPGLSNVYAELMSQNEGSEIYVKTFNELMGLSWGEVAFRFKNSVAIGIVSADKTKAVRIAPSLDSKIEEGDLIVFIAKSFAQIVLSPSGNKSDSEIISVERSIAEVVKTDKKLLLMGWSEKALYVVKEVIKSESYSFNVDIVSIHESEERERTITSLVGAELKGRVRNIELDYAQPETFDQIDIESYDNILFMTNDWISSVGEADARSILGVLNLRSKEGEKKTSSSVLIELSDPENEKLFSKRSGETIISPIVVSSLIANISLRPELSRVFDVLFDSGGAEIFFKSAKQLQFTGALSFGDIQQKLKSQTSIPIGLRHRETDLYHINPEFSEVFSNIENFDVILLG